jgi:FixJ family two-component response regulator
MIYIIDDDPFVRRGVSILFKSAKLDMVTYASAEEFLKHYMQGENDIMILDLHMPGMDGCELLKEIASREIYLPVIIMTAYDDPASRDFAKSNGALAFLRKPVDGEALIDLVKYAINPV